MVALALTMYTPGRLDVDVLVHHRRRVGRELADDLFEDVLERDEALDVAVFVDHEGEPAAVALEVARAAR